MNPFGFLDAINTGRTIYNGVNSLFNKPKPNVLGIDTNYAQYQQSRDPNIYVSTNPQLNQYAGNTVKPTPTAPPAPRPAASPTTNQVTAPSTPSYDDILRRQYGDQLNQLNTDETSTLDRLGSVYANTMQEAQNTLSRNLGALSQAKGDVTQGYANQKTEQARLLRDTQRNNNIYARAAGNNASGWFQNLQSRAAGKTQDGISRLGQAEQSALDNIGLEYTNQQNTGNTAIQRLREELAASQGDVRGRASSARNSLGSGLQNALDTILIQRQGIADQAARAGALRNPLTDMIQKAQQMAAIQQFAQPVQEQNLLARLGQDVQSGTQQLNNVVGYLDKIDPRLSLQFQSNLRTTPSSGGFLGIGSKPASYQYTGQGYQDPNEYLKNTYGFTGL